MTKSSSSRITKETLANADWYQIACKIRHQNRELKAQIIELEELTSRQKQEIDEQRIELEKQDNLFQQQEQKINSLNTELNSQLNQVESTNQGDEKQQLFIESLSQELQQVQQQAARLERECSYLQDKYNQQEHLLKQKQKENRELQIRLQRQQRYNLQYKSALDKYLQSNQDHSSTSEKNVSNQSENTTIKPWNKGQYQDKLEQDLDKIAPRVVTDLAETLVESETQIQGNITEEIPELIYEENDQTTEAKIDDLMGEILPKMEQINSQISQSQITNKNLNLPIIKAMNKQKVDSGKTSSDPNSKYINNDQANNKKNKGSHKFLRLPRFGKKKQE